MTDFFEPGWLQAELDAASAEVASWPAGMQRMMNGEALAQQELIRDAEALIQKSLKRFGQEISDNDLRSAAIKIVNSLPKISPSN